MNIPVARPFIGEEEAAAVRDVILSGWVTQGPKVAKFEEAFASFAGAGHACAVSSCTTALHLALLVVGVRPGDIVITASHSFIATANSVRHAGAEPVFVDIEPDTFNMSPTFLEKLLKEDCEKVGGDLYFRDAAKLAVGESPLKNLVNDKASFRVGRVAAVLAVHQMGMPCDIGGILGVARKYGLPVVEDAACAAGSEVFMEEEWQRAGRPHGDVACFSFHPRKVLTTGDGGMLTTNNPEYDRKVRLLRQHGMSIPDAVRHGARKVVLEKYVTTGYNYRMTDIHAAVGLEQLKKLPAMVARRREQVERYRDLLSGLQGLGLPAEPEWARSNWQSFCVRLPEGIDQVTVMQGLLDKGISTRRGIMCAHKEAPYENDMWNARLPESSRAEERCILLPLFHEMTGEQMEYVADSLKEIAGGKDASS